MGVARCGRKGKPAPQPLGPCHRGRSPQNECREPRQENARLPARRGAVADDRSLPADDRHAAQRRPGQFLSFPRITRPRRLRRREEPGGSDAETRSPVLPPPRERSPRYVPRSGHWRGQGAVHQTHRPHDRISDHARRTRLVRRLNSVRRRPVHQSRVGGFRARSRAWLHDGDASTPVRFEHLRRAPESSAHEGKARTDSRRPRRLPPRAD